MSNEINYEQIFQASLKYIKDSGRILDGIKRVRGWEEILAGDNELFYNPSYFMYGVNKFKNAPTSDKYSFLKCHYSLYHFGFKDPKLEEHRKSFLSFKISFLHDMEEILGPSLVLANAQAAILDSSFNRQDYTGPGPLQPNHIYAFEFAPIIDAWFDMWIELKNEWKESFNEIYISYDPLNTIKPALPAHQRFLDKREKIIDSLIKTGRLTTRDLWTSL